MEDDDLMTADPFHAKIPAGALIDVPGFGPATVVYHDLDGYGVIAGHEDVDVNDLPEPEALLREPYECADWPCIGETFRYAETGEER